MLDLGAFIVGLLAGSFVNAVVWRLHLRNSKNSIEEKGADRRPNQRAEIESRTSIAKGRSACPKCGHKLAAVDLIPIFSWVLLGGQCRYCQKSISIQYPLVEMGTALLFTAVVAVMPPASLLDWVEMGFWFYFIGALMTLAVYDLHWYILPDAVLLPAIAIGVVRLAVLAGFGLGASEVAQHLVSALVLGGAFYAVAALSNGRWMGGGDIKLAFFMGLVLGPAKGVLAMLVAFNSAAVIGVLLIALKLKGRRDYIPFGPFLAVGVMAAWLAGESLIGWYLRVLGAA